MKRILIFGMSSNPGGIENFIMNVYRNIDRNKIQFDFLVQHDIGKIAYEDEIIKMGGKIYKQYYTKKEFYKKNAISLKHFFMEHTEIDGVHLNLCTLNSSFRIIKIAKEFNIPIRIIHSHNAGYMRKQKLREKLYEIYVRRELSKYVTTKLACSREAGRWMFNSDDFIIINNGIDVNKFKYNNLKRNEIRKKLKIGENDFVVGHVGRMNYQKNPEFIIDIFYSILKKNNAAKLLYIGDGELKNVIESKIRRYHIENNVILLGKINDTSEYYNAMDVFLLPSRFEGLPIALLEAQCNGLNCFVSNTISREAGLTDLVKFININYCQEMWAKEILELDNNFRREDCCDDISKKWYNILSTIKRLEKIYCE